MGGMIVDSFMNKIAEKISAQDIIRANSQAETAEAARIKQEAEQYKLQLEELKKNTRIYQDKIDAMQKLLEESEGKTHDVGVQTYRNVQAVVDKSHEKTIDEFKEVNRKLESVMVGIETKNSASIPLLVLVLLVAGADLVINILRLLGIL